MASDARKLLTDIYEAADCGLHGGIPPEEGLADVRRLLRKRPAEHPDAALRERLGALADDLEATAKHGNCSNLSPYEWRPYAQCAAAIRALLRTEGQPPHPNPMCPHTLECLCEEDE